MKRTIVTLLVLALSLAALASCQETAEPSSEYYNGSCTYLQDDSIILPTGGQKLELEHTQKAFAPFITDSLLSDAERKLLEDTSEYGNTSGFYLAINDEYLCLALEVIAPTPDGDGECGGHTHLFFNERISALSYSEILSENGTVQFFPYAIMEFQETDAFSPESFEVSRLSENSVKALQRLYAMNKGWTSDAVVDRMPFCFDGRMYFKAGDTEGWMYFDLDNYKLYYDDRFTTIPQNIAKELADLCPAEHNADIKFRHDGLGGSSVLSDEDMQFLLQLLCRHDWEDGADIFKTGITFTGNDLSLVYCADEGVLYDHNKIRKIALTHDDKDMLDSIAERYLCALDVRPFSYDKVAEAFREGMPGVKYDGFKNTDACTIRSATDAASRAKNECTIYWNVYYIEHDETQKVWAVTFGKHNTLGGCQTVYLSSDGKTMLIVYGE